MELTSKTILKTFFDQKNETKKKEEKQFLDLKIDGEKNQFFEKWVLNAFYREKVQKKNNNNFQSKLE